MSTTNPFENKVTDKLFTHKSYVCVRKHGLVLDNPQGLICHKIQTNQPTNMILYNLVQKTRTKTKNRQKM